MSKRCPGRRLHWAAVESLEARRLLAAGDLDPTFGGTGQLTTDIDQTLDEVAELAVQADGKIIAVGSASPDSNFGGDFAIVRYTVGGDLDPTFASTGKVRLSLGAVDAAQAVVVQPDGKILVGGYAGRGGYDFDFALVRFKADGALDTGFGTGGVVLTDFGSKGVDRIEDLALQSDGRIVAVGRADSPATGLGMARYNADGSLDDTFGVGGKVVGSGSIPLGDAFQVEMLGDGRMLVAGRGTSASRQTTIGLVRLKANGAIDPTFATNGMLNDDVGVTEPRGLAVAPDGTLYIAATVQTATPVTSVFAYTFDGAKKTAFGASGKTDIATGGFFAFPHGLAVQADGKVVVAATSRGAVYRNWTVARVLPTGALDGTFGSGGKVVTAIGPLDTEAHALAIQADHKIIVGGYSSWDMALARYLPGAVDVPPFATLDAGGVLTVTGTAAEDVIRMFVSGGVFYAKLNDRTMTFPSASVASVKVMALGGNDAVYLDGGVSGGFIELGDGHDTLHVGLANRVGATMSVAGGEGDDTVNVAVAAFLPINFAGGAGVDTLNFNGSEGDDEIALRAGKVTGGGNEARYADLEKLNVYGNWGYDHIDVSPGVGAGPEIMVDAGAGRDQVEVWSAPLYTPFVLRAGADDDRLIIHSDAYLVATVDGGEGSDSLEFLSSEGNDAIQMSVSALSDAYSTLAHSGLETFSVFAKYGYDTITVASLPAGSALSIDAGPGNDTIHFNGTGAGVMVNVMGGEGNDTFNYAVGLERAAKFVPGAGSDILNISQGLYALDSDLSPQGNSLALTVNVSNDAVLELNSSQHLAALNVNDNARVRVASGGEKTLVAKSITIGTQAGVDLADNDLVVRTVIGSRQQVVDLLHIYIKAGLSNSAGAWSGRGLVSSSAASNPAMALAVGLNDAGSGRVLYPVFANQTVDTASVLVKYTVQGDADLNGQTDAGDYLRIDESVKRGLSRYFYNGDFDYSGTIDSDDYAILDASFTGAGRVPGAGALDPAFASAGTGSGRYYASNTDEARAVAIQPDGKIVAAGVSGDGAVIVRYDAFGALDPSFGSGGVVKVIAGGAPVLNDVKVGANGKIIAGGSVYIAAMSSTPARTYPAVFRFNADGTPDTAFGTGGVSLINTTYTSDVIRSVTLDGDQNILFTGKTGSVTLFGRLRSNGTLDTGFRSGNVSLSGGIIEGRGIEVLPSGKILIGGSAAGAPAFMRFNANGSTDTTLRQSGIATMPGINTPTNINAMLVQEDGAVVLGGQAGSDSLLVRFTSTGAPDQSFGLGGMQVIDAAPGVEDAVRGLGQAPGGGIYAAGGFYTDAMVSISVFLMRLGTDGEPDPAFAGDGIYAGPLPNDISGYAMALAVQGDGRVVTAGGAGTAASDTDLALARFTAEGAADPTFGAGGSATLDVVGAKELVARAAAFGDDGKAVFVHASTVPGDLAVARSTSTGEADVSFAGGMVLSDFGGSESAMVTLVQPDGKVLVGGTTNSGAAGATFDFVLARYNGDGTLDGTFGSGGKVITDVRGHDFVSALALGADGKIIAAGRSVDGSVRDTIIVRYNDDGSLDSTFGDGGKVVLDISYSDSVSAARVLGDGRIVFAGTAADYEGTSDIVLLCLRPDGTLDPQFGTGGKAIADFGNSQETLTALTVDSEGRIIAAGQFAAANGPVGLLMVRYTSSGQIDPTFGDGGKVIAYRGSEVSVKSLLVQPDGKIVAGGDSRVTGTFSTGRDFALARFHADGRLDGTFGDAGWRTFDFGGSNDSALALRWTAEGRIGVAGTITTLASRPANVVAQFIA